MTEASRPFRVLGIQQIAIGGKDKSALRALWVDLLGLHAEGSFRSEKENVDEDILALGEGPHRVEVDLMQPIDPERAPRVHEPPLNHIGLWIDDLPKAVEWLTAQGVRFTPGGIRKGASGHDVCFIHPKGNEQFPLGGQGVLLELGTSSCGSDCSDVHLDRDGEAMNPFKPFQFGLFQQTFQLIEDTMKNAFKPRGIVRIEAAPLAGPPGTEVSGTIHYISSDQTRAVRAVHLHLQMAITKLQPSLLPDGQHSFAPHTERRDVAPPALLGGPFTVAQGTEWSQPFRAKVPEGLPPSTPGSLDYLIVAQVELADDAQFRAWGQSPFLVTAATGAPTVSPVKQAGFQPGDACVAPSPDGSFSAGMVVENRGAVTLVQWNDGRPAMWIRTELLRNT